jgi:hypothetical protein
MPGAPTATPTPPGAPTATPAPAERIVNVGAPAEPLSVSVSNLVGKRRSFAGSATGGLPQTQEMLNFCAEHHLSADVEIIPADQINHAYERVLGLRRPLPLRHRHRHPRLTCRQHITPQGTTSVTAFLLRHRNGGSGHRSKVEEVSDPPFIPEA